jgi:hypothetical protein
LPTPRSALPTVRRPNAGANAPNTRRLRR